jgi:hypothetical protein
MKHVVECLTDFTVEHSTGRATNICVGDWLNWSGHGRRGTWDICVFRRSYARGEHVAFASRAAATAFLAFHNGKFRYLGRFP